MKKAVTLGASALALFAAASIAPAAAADIYPAPPGGGYKDGPAYIPGTWTGFYMGVNGGYGWSANSNQFASTGFPGEGGYGAFRGLSPAGGFGGGQIGYNWQGAFGHPALVLGIEADIQGAGINDSKTTVDNSGVAAKSSLDWFGTVRGRIGYAGSERTLLYFTGGFAFGGLNSRVDSGDGVASFDDTVTGYVLGGGVEYKFNSAWSAKAEYQYLNFGKNDPRFSDGSSVSREGFKVNDDAFHTVRAGINYHVLPAYEPLK